MLEDIFCVNYAKRVFIFFTKKNIKNTKEKYQSKGNFE